MDDCLLWNVFSMLALLIMHFFILLLRLSFFSLLLLSPRFESLLLFNQFLFRKEFVDFQFLFRVYLIIKTSTQEVKLIIFSNHLNATTIITSFHNTHNHTKRLLLSWIWIELYYRNVLSVGPNVHQVLLFMKYN